MDELRTTSGQILGERFQLEEPIARGGAATVWRARDLLQSRMVAVKVLHREVRDQAKMRERFVREAHVLTALDHPHIARAYTFDMEGTLPYMAMELVEGEALDAELGRRAELDRWFSIDDVIAILDQSASALAHAHGSGVVHRDLKPSNILLAPAAAGRNVKLVDFGIAKLLDLGPGEDTTQGRLLGTLMYMSPEQARALVVDHRADVFALGAIAFELLTLRRVWARDENGRPLRAYAEPVRINRYNGGPELLERISREVRPSACAIRPELGAGVDTVIATAMAVEPADRFQRAGAFVEALAEALGEAVSAWGRGPPVPRALTDEHTEPGERIEATAPRDLIGPDEGGEDTDVLPRRYQSARPLAPVLGGELSGAESKPLRAPRRTRTAMAAAIAALLLAGVAALATLDRRSPDHAPQPRAIANTPEPGVVERTTGEDPKREPTEAHAGAEPEGASHDGTAKRGSRGDREGSQDGVARRGSRGDREGASYDGAAKRVPRGDREGASYDGAAKRVPRGDREGASHDGTARRGSRGGREGSQDGTAKRAPRGDREGLQEGTAKRAPRGELASPERDAPGERAARDPATPSQFRRELRALAEAPSATALAALADRIASAAGDLDDPRTRARIARLAHSSAAIGDHEGVDRAIGALETALEAQRGAH